MNQDFTHKHGGSGDDALERRLAGLPLTNAPAGLRRRVMAAAAEVGALASPERRATASWWDAFWLRWPLGSGGLAAAWLFVGVALSADHWLNGSSPQAVVSVPREQMAEARRQRSELWQLAGLEGDRPEEAKPMPEPVVHPVRSRPRSEWRREETERFAAVAEEALS